MKINKGTVVIRTWLSLHEGSLKITLTVPLRENVDLKRASSMLQVDRRLVQPAEYIFLCQLGRTPACVETKGQYTGHFIFLFCRNREALFFIISCVLNYNKLNPNPT